MAAAVAGAQGASSPPLPLWCAAAGDGIAYALRNQDGGVLWNGLEPAPSGTVNERDYHALIAGVRAAIAHGTTRFTLLFASALQLNQLHGTYKVKAPALAELCRALTDELKNCDVSYRLITKGDREHADLQQLKGCAKAQSWGAE